MANSPETCRRLKGGNVTCLFSPSPSVHRVPRTLLQHSARDLRETRAPALLKRISGRHACNANIGLHFVALLRACLPRLAVTFPGKAEPLSHTPGGPDICRGSLCTNNTESSERGVVGVHRAAPLPLHVGKGKGDQSDDPANLLQDRRPQPRAVPIVPADKPINSMWQAH